jgi:hypothetical protein
MNFIRTEKLPGRQRNRPLKDYTGERFGRLTAIQLVERDLSKENNHLWLFRCDCGNEKAARIKAVRAGHTTSCGCAFRDLMVERNTTHGLVHTQPREYRSWKDMRGRCFNPNNDDYPDYGGRGITACERWSDFAAFFADMGRRPKGYSLDRINVNGNYEPGNCRWAPPGVQARNKRNNHRLTLNGETRTLAEWCRHFGLDHSKVRYRLKQGWPVEKAFSLVDWRR